MKNDRLAQVKHRLQSIYDDADYALHTEAEKPEEVRIRNLKEIRTQARRALADLRCAQ